MTARQIRFPLLCQAIRLPKLPMLGGESRYAVIWGAGLKEPEGGLGYIAALTGRRSGRVVGWVRDGGYVFSCDDLLDEAPEEAPAVTLSLWRNRRDAGCVTVSSGGSRQEVSEFEVSGGEYVFVDPVRDLGDSCRSVRFGFKAFLALAYLAFVHVPGTGDEPESAGRTMGDVLDELLELPPADAVDTLVADVLHGERTSGFERYAARIMRDSDPASLREISASHSLAWRRLGSTGLFWTSVALDDLSEGELRVVLGFESVLNRLSLIARRARSNGGDDLSSCSEGYCADEDWRVLRSIDRPGSWLLFSYKEENPYRTVFGVSSERGGEWDVRTRLARALEETPMPYRLAYRYDVDVSLGEARIACWTPPADLMPRWMVDPGAPGELACCDDRAGAAATSYALRLAVLIAEMAFGTSPSITRARICLSSDVACRHPVLVADWDRTAFIGRVHERVRGDAFADRRLVWDVSGLKGLLGDLDATFSMDDDLALRELGADSAPVGPDAARRLPLAEDDRPIGDALAKVLHADRVSELDVFHLGDDPFEGAVRRAVELCGTDQRAAAQKLADLLQVMAIMDGLVLDDANDDGVPELAPMGDDGSGVRRAYCSSDVARLALSLLADDDRTRFTYVRDSAYDACRLLAQLCIANDDPEHGLAYAEDAIEMGPTSPAAYDSAVRALMAQERYGEAMGFLNRALGLILDIEHLARLYYRAGYVQWRLGNLSAAYACYERALASAMFHDAAREEMDELAGGMEGGAPAPQEAEAAMRRAGVVVAPTDELCALAARAVLGACDEGLLNVASRYAPAIREMASGDAVVSALLSLYSWDG